MAKSPAAILFDSTGANPVGVVLDGAVYRLTVEAKVTGGNPNSPVAVSVQSSFPEDPTRFVKKYALNGSSSDMRVNGSVTPVVFVFPADSTKDIRVYEIRFVFSANSTPFGANKFGPEGGGLTNGLQLTAFFTSVETELANIKINEDFLSLVPASDTVVDQTGAADVIAAGVALGSAFKLRAGTTDEIRVRVRDNIAGMAGMQHLKCTVLGVKDP